MKIDRKLPAFTLSEMVVVMILTTIVVGLAFSVLNLVQKHMQSIQNNFTKNMELQKLEQVLWLDFNRYSSIEFNALDEELKFSTPLDSVNYHIQENRIIKGRDTFNISIKKKWLFFQGNESLSGNIDAIKLECSKDNQNKIIFIFKENDSAVLMN